MKVLNKEGNVDNQEMNLFQALAQATRTGTQALLPNLVLGKRQITQSQKVYNYNWNVICDMIDSIVQKQVEIKSTKSDADVAELTCLIDIMLESEVYQNDPTKITSDLIFGLNAGMDTSKNTSITTICHLAKNKVSKEKVRLEIERSLRKKFNETNGDILQHNHADLKNDQFDYLNMLVKESLRFQTPIQFTDAYLT